MLKRGAFSGDTIQGKCCGFRFRVRVGERDRKGTKERERKRERERENVCVCVRERDLGGAGQSVKLGVPIALGEHAPLPVHQREVHVQIPLPSFNIPQ